MTTERARGLSKTDSRCTRMAGGANKIQHCPGYRIHYDAVHSFRIQDPWINTVRILEGCQQERRQPQDTSDRANLVTGHVTNVGQTGPAARSRISGSRGLQQGCTNQRVLFHVPWDWRLRSRDSTSHGRMEAQVFGAP